MTNENNSLDKNVPKLLAYAFAYTFLVGHLTFLLTFSYMHSFWLLSAAAAASFVVCLLVSNEFVHHFLIAAAGSSKERRALSLAAHHLIPIPVTLMRDLSHALQKFQHVTVQAAGGKPRGNTRLRSCGINAIW